MQRFREQQTESSGNVKPQRDPITIDGQQYALISFVAPSGARQRSKFVQVKIRGVFDDDDEAQAHAKKLHEKDPDFDIHVVRMYEWLRIPPPQEVYEAVPMEYDDPDLDKVMKNYYSQQEAQRKAHEKRVKEAKAKSNALLDKVDLG